MKDDPGIGLVDGVAKRSERRAGLEKSVLRESGE
jgi:hypothetical protein